MPAISANIIADRGHGPLLQVVITCLPVKVRLTI